METGGTGKKTHPGVLVEKESEEQNRPAATEWPWFCINRLSPQLNCQKMAITSDQHFKTPASLVRDICIEFQAGVGKVKNPAMVFKNLKTRLHG